MASVDVHLAIHLVACILGFHQSHFCACKRNAFAFFLIFVNVKSEVATGKSQDRKVVIEHGCTAAAPLICCLH